MYELENNHFIIDTNLPKKEGNNCKQLHNILVLIIRVVKLSSEKYKIKEVFWLEINILKVKY